MQSAAKPFKVLGLQQIAVGGLDKGPLQTLWVCVMYEIKVFDKLESRFVIYILLRNMCSVTLLE